MFLENFKYLPTGKKQTQEEIKNLVHLTLVQEPELGPITKETIPGGENELEQKDQRRFKSNMIWNYLLP